MSPPSLALDLNPFRDVWHRQGHLCPPTQKLGGARAETIRPPHDTIRIAIFTSRFDFFGSIHLTTIKGNESLWNSYFSIILKIFLTNFKIYLALYCINHVNDNWNYFISIFLEKQNSTEENKVCLETKFNLSFQLHIMSVLVGGGGVVQLSLLRYWIPKVCNIS